MAVLPSFLSRFAAPLRASPLALAALLVAPTAIAQEDLLAGPVHLPANLRSLQETDAHGLTGIWTGLSDDGRPSILSFEHAGADGAVAIMLAQAGRAWDRGLGRRVGAEVRFSIGETLWTGTYRSPGRLILRSANGYERIVLSSNDLDTLLDPAWHDDFHGAEELALPAAPDTDGTPNTLKTLLYSPPGPGPFPLAVLHHGATDSGDDPGAFGRVWTHRGLAEELMDRGFAVAVPQRRGRGGSTGDYAEGLAPAPALGYSCLPEEALKGFARAQEDVAMAMDALFAHPTIDARQPAVLIGNSRGGALALDWAGQNPERTRAVINFVGGWVEESCAQADAINAATLANAPAFTGPSLWLYGSGDVLYGPEHTQSLFAKHIDAGGRGAYHLAHIPWEGSGHQLISYPPHYQAQLNALLARIAPAN